MNASERKQVGRVIALTASYYGKDLSSDVVGMMLDDLSAFNAHDVVEAYKTYRLDPKNTYFPLPAKIIGILKPSVDDRSIAMNLAKRIEKAIRHHGNSWPMGVLRKTENGLERYFEGGGYAWPSFEKAVLSELGEVGFEVVRSYGWAALEENYFNSERGVFFAQLRDLTESILKHDKAGVMDELPKLSKGTARGAHEFLESNVNHHQVAALLDNGEIKKQGVKNAADLVDTLSKSKSMGGTNV